MRRHFHPMLSTFLPSPSGRFYRHLQPSRSDANPSDESYWIKTVQLLHFFHNGPTEISNERLSNSSPRSTGSGEWISLWWSPASHSDAAEPPELTSPMATINSTVNPFDVPEPPHTFPPPATPTQLITETS